LETLDKDAAIVPVRSDPTIAATHEENVPLLETPPVSDQELVECARALAANWETGRSDPQAKREVGLRERLKELSSRLEQALSAARHRRSGKGLTPQLEFLESSRALEGALKSTDGAVYALQKLPHTRIAQGSIPRIIHLTEAYLECACGIWSPATFKFFIQEVQNKQVLLLSEVLLAQQALIFAQLEFILDRAHDLFGKDEIVPIQRSPLSAPIHSLRRLNQFEWRGLLESITSFDEILRQDPVGAFTKMEDETRYSYHQRVAQLAQRSDCSEIDTAHAALELCRIAQSSSETEPRSRERMQHIGYYLFAEGLPALKKRIGYHPRPTELMLDFVRSHNEDFYTLCIIVLSIALITPIIAPVVPRNPFLLVMSALLLSLLPVTQGAVELVNGLITSLLKAESLPKIDYSKGVDADSTTMVVVPTLLLSDTQVQDLYDELEARYLSNEDPNIHFALLTDLPDSPSQPPPDDKQPLVQKAIRLTEILNAKYGGQKGGSFLLLHRHRVFNVREGVWMGWERKRGKLLDLNRLLLHEFDSFPVKSGPLHVLDHVRYVITLDSDTQLPRSTAARMIGTMAHPLNRAIIDPRSRIVTAGYGILQPRVGVSVASASRSRLAAIYSGETGYDIYTRAVSDVYQDLFGEGIFAGKGIYEVSVLHKALECRFPRNALLSHDLIEGAYVRAGLVSDIEIIDDYPSQYAAHQRRKHRWIRGDWQILRWVFAEVPDESGRMVRNPISTISQWKILDNLRRSLVEPVTFLVLLLGYFVFPGGARYWTNVTVTLLLLPSLAQLALDLARAIFTLDAGAIRGAFSAWLGQVAFALINLTFLAQQMLLSLDAIIRTLIRSFVSGKHLLQWESAAQSEADRGRSIPDIYLLISPLIAILIGSGLVLRNPRSLMFAGPILFLWLIAPIAALWLNSPPQKQKAPLKEADKRFLHRQALSLWRFYADFGGVDNHWLIPDNIEEKDMHAVRKLSPTNLGMLLNARQAARELGFLTVPEFAVATLGTLTTYQRIEKHRGHIYNWYEIETLQPIAPFTISTVDSGNLAASFYTLHGGALQMLTRPILEAKDFSIFGLDERHASKQPHDLGLESLVGRLFNAASSDDSKVNRVGSDPRLMKDLQDRRTALRRLIELYLPWLLPEYAGLRRLGIPPMDEMPSLQDAEQHLQRLTESLTLLSENASLSAAVESLLDKLRLAGERLKQLKQDIEQIVDVSESFAETMDFSFLFVESRQLLSIGYDGRQHELHSACYDLLASEARIATFLAVAKGDIPQRAWFQLDRSHVLVKGRAALVSWTGTMFEYMMPALWMRTFPQTLLTNSLESVARIQRNHVRKMPWGISESGFAKADPQGRYGYQAWGIPKLSLKYGAEDGPVISPYSTFLAMSFLRDEALANLKKMATLGWVGQYGFYEAADYSEGGAPQLVRSWMAHHQGMSLLAVTNLLRNGTIQEWFHANPRVRAAESMLHEKALKQDTLRQLEERTEHSAA
jgi:cyclic beta-1,2-glucan synthetase